ncbi:nuclear pore complex component-domain-containing protein [Clohesyomyces aquaticus]|uniref:Nuclear pore complex component-domain-containing protein n=1 Tax=Clohesyomyces aquaticus TaxID=1231657 RepID=A0A1Y1YHF2_9PLEO|nr:nuclear pore complex component-domain-containing protein [Clohesyomyces aquaticus]
MSTPATPATPAAQKQQQPTPAGGKWRHPQFNEITRRQYATTFDESNVRQLVVNGVLLLGSFSLFSVAEQVALFRSIATFVGSFTGQMPYNAWYIWLLRLLFLGNIAFALMPLARRYYPDDIVDIPLTPSQRQAMGLDPNVSTPATPGSVFASPNYVTPPRYQKSTPRGSFSASQSQNPSQSHSPLSGSPIALGKSTSNSPFSPNTASPLFQKAMGGGSATKRLSYDNRGTPLSGGSFFGDSSSSNTPGTPTPGMGKASVGLNNKWLYEKRRDSPSSKLFN